MKTPCPGAQWSGVTCGIASVIRVIALPARGDARSDARGDARSENAGPRLMRNSPQTARKAAVNDVELTRIGAFRQYRAVLPEPRIPESSSMTLRTGHQSRRALFSITIILACLVGSDARAQYEILPDKSVARNWSEVLLEALRRDSGQVAVNARNVFHFSVAVYDAWAAYDENARPYLLGNTVNGFNCPFASRHGIPISEDSRRITISYAAFRLLQHRFINSTGSLQSFQKFNALMDHYGLNKDHTATTYAIDGSAASLGNYIADCVIRYGLNDGSNESDDHRTRLYQPVNPPLAPTDPVSIQSIVDPDRWQKLDIGVFVTKTGDTIAPPDFETPEWGRVAPFAMDADDRTLGHRDGGEYWIYKDPGKPPLISQTDPDALPEEYIWGHSLVAVWTGHLDPARGHGAELIDISPASIGNNPAFPTTIADLRSFYDFLGGADSSLGHAENPATGEAYAPQLVPLADYTRVLIQYWADGPFTAETPAGFMMGLLNREVSDAPGFEKRLGGTGPLLDDLEWDVKAYFAISAATHDAAVAAWSVKGWYDYVRPISAIRFMAMRGQSSDPDDPDCPYHPQGIEYVADPTDPAGDGSLRVIDCVRPGDPLADGGTHVGKIKIFSWRGPESISNPNFEVAGVDWILAENWWPMMRPDFVTPPFAGYISGHSTLTRAGAEVLTLLTGSPYFPSGMYEFFAETNEFLVYEDGPSVDVTLQWATFFDVSDAAGISRLWGGVHPPVDDIVGRRIGAEVGVNAHAKAVSYFSGRPPRTQSGGGGGAFDTVSFLLLAGLILWAPLSARLARRRMRQTRPLR